MYRFIFHLALAKLPFTEAYLEVHFPSPKQKADLQAELYSEKKNKEAFQKTECVNPQHVCEGGTREGQALQMTALYHPQLAYQRKSVSDKK